MKTAKTQSFLLALIFLCPLVLKAEQWKILGPRPMGMGGAFVAVAKGPIAQYWNPAGLAQDENVSGLEFPIGFRAEFTGDILENANKLGDLVDKYTAIQAAQKNGTKINADQMATVVEGLAVLSSMNKRGSGLLADVEGGANLKLGKIAISVNNFTSVGASPFIDTINIGLGTIPGWGGGVTLSADVTDPNADYIAARDTIESAITTIGYSAIANLICGSGGCGTANDSTTLANALVNEAVGTLTSAQIQEAANIMLENAALAASVIQKLASGDNHPYTDNTSNLTVRGASFTELAFGYAKPLLLPGLYVGGNVKLIFGKVGYHQFLVLQDDAGTSDVLKDYTKNTKTSARPGIDLGALLEVDKLLPNLPLKPRVGLVMRNINNPKFKQPDAGKAAGESDYAHNGQVRGGLAISPFNFWTLAMDLDITNNLTPIPGYKSRQLGIGSEINVFNRPWINIPLRVGILKNLSDNSSGMAYTFGFGINLMHFLFDIGGSISSKKVTSDEGDEIPSNVSVAAGLALLF